MTISVCIPTVRTTTLGHAVRAVLEQTWQDWELLVVGQGPDEDGLRQAVKEAAQDDPRVRYVHCARTGLSCARNAGMALASGEIIAFTDDDCEPAMDWLAVIQKAFDDDPAIGFVGGSVLRPPDGPTGWLTTCPVNEPAEIRYDPVADGGRRPQGWDWIGANFAIRRAVAQRVGPFDTVLGAGTEFPSGEDTDWKFRMEDLGIVMLTTPRAVVQHTYGARSGLKAGFAHSRNYARGNAAMAAKLTLQGDPRGAQWRSEALRGTAEERRKDLRPHRMPVAVWRRWHFARAYRTILHEYELNSEGMLQAMASREWGKRAVPA